ncbi:MAG TPA: hypothetical protein VEV43_02310 [Actinomycetota bacterium]|nr:hypothetical protein [Actinomycetota bacterium]
MGENLVENVELPEPPLTGNPAIDRMVDWVRTNYNDLVTLCEANNLPKPPHW